MWYTKYRKKESEGNEVKKKKDENRGATWVGYFPRKTKTKKEKERANSKREKQKEGWK